MINMIKYMGDDFNIDRVSLGFYKRYKYVLRGAIVTLNGWLVRVSRPGWIKDIIKNQNIFFSKKGFYALKFQCIVDYRNKVQLISHLGFIQ